MLLKYLDNKDSTNFCDWRQICACICHYNLYKVHVCRTLVYGPGGKNRSSSLFFVVIFFFWTYPIYFFKASLYVYTGTYIYSIFHLLFFAQVVPPTLAEHHNVHLCYWIFSALLWIMFPWAKFADPGVIKANKTAYDEAVKLVCSLIDHPIGHDGTTMIICHTDRESFCLGRFQ